MLIDHNSSGDSRIIKTFDRKTYFSRRDPDKGKGEQAVAANFDYVFIMQSLNHDFNPKRLERYLTAARQSKAEPVVVLTKADLTDDYLPYIIETSRVAENVPTCIVSSKTGYGMEELSPYLQKGKTLGRHTTTHRELIMLRNGVMIIDTPGMRELGMWDVTEGLDDAFSDVEKLAQMCRFRNCRHENEPGCAVREAIENGELRLSRFESYQKIKAEAKYSGDSAEYRRQKEQFFKSIAISERKKRKDVY